MRLSLLLVALLCTLPARAADLRGLVAQERAATGNQVEQLRARVGIRMAQRHFVFVKGFLNEGLPYYFDKNIEALKELGATSISVCSPHSNISIGDDADRLLVVLTTLNSYGTDKSSESASIPCEKRGSHDGKGRPITLIGHSKGGAESLLAVIRYPQLIFSDIVSDVITIQAATSSPVADIAETMCGPKKSPCHRIRNLIEPGLRALRPEVAEPLFRQALERLASSPDLRALVSSRIHYVRAAQEAGSLDYDHVGPGLRMSHAYLRQWSKDLGLSEDNDGLVALAKQRLEDIGSDLGGATLDGDHGDLIVHSNLYVFGSILGDRYRTRDIKGFTRAAIRALFGE